MSQKPWTTVFRAAHAAKNLILNRIDPPVIVLVYHRIASLASDPEMLAVTPENFRAQLQLLKATFPLVRFEDDWTTATKPAIAVTFDDGYADNALEALPILEEVGVPATFFVSTGTINTPREFWWNELERIVLGAHGLPSSFKLCDDRFAKEWPTATDVERQAFYRDLGRLMTDACTEVRETWLSQLRQWAQCKEEVTDMHRAMTTDELRRLAANKWVTIGAHTVTHTQLSSLSPKAQREEIVASKRQLEAWLGNEIRVFSYPYGRQCHYTGETVAICREAGFTKAAANFSGQVHRWTDPYQIPRHLVRNWTAGVFAEKVKRFWRS